MAVHGAQVPWGRVVIQGVPVVAARRLPSMLRELPAALGPERVAVLADQARVASTPPRDPGGRAVSSYRRTNTMDSVDRNGVGIIGAGRLGQAMARTVLRAGRSVVIA